jgi:hypothetical protein
MVQFFRSQHAFSISNDVKSYPTHDRRAALTLPDHITCAFANATACHLPRWRQAELDVAQLGAQFLVDVILLIAAMKRVLD